MQAEIRDKIGWGGAEICPVTHESLPFSGLTRLRCEICDYLRCETCDLPVACGVSRHHRLASGPRGRGSLWCCAAVSRYYHAVFSRQHTTAMYTASLPRRIAAQGAVLIIAGCAAAVVGSELPSERDCSDRAC